MTTATADDALALLRLAAAEKVWLTLRDEDPGIAQALQLVVAAGGTLDQLRDYGSTLALDPDDVRRVLLAAEYVLAQHEARS